MMKLICSFAILFLFNTANADCYKPKIARDSVRAMALIGSHSNITDLVGSCSTESVCDIWANYRYHNYSDRYQVKVKDCRVSSFKLLEKNIPIKN